MSDCSQKPELSIIVPTLNEEGSLPELFASLGWQKNIDFELIVSDGGSQDSTLCQAECLASQFGVPLEIVRSGRGRGRQLNTGARMARAETLLFLHADSRFSSCSALSRALSFLHAAIEEKGCESLAGRFALRFSRSGNDSARGYAFYEAKARLNRPDCIHGDQGFLLRKSFFDRVGPFDETLSFLEDCRLAEAVFQKGEWLLLPADIWTSARRFEVEGLRSRQILNALVMNFHAIGWDAFFHEIPAVYASQDRSRRLELLPFFRKIRELLRPLPWKDRALLWYRTGGYVRNNAWQIAFAWLLLRRSKKQEVPVDANQMALELFDSWFDRFTDHPPGRMLTAMLVWIWFLSTFACLFARESCALLRKSTQSRQKRM